MKDLERVTFKIENDEQEFTLVYDFNEICDAESVVGVNLLRAIAHPAFMSAVECRGLLYACLKQAHPLVLLKEAGDLLSRDGKAVTEALGRVLGAEENQAETSTSIPAEVPAPAVVE